MAANIYYLTPTCEMCTKSRAHKLYKCTLKYVCMYVLMYDYIYMCKYINTILIFTLHSNVKLVRKNLVRN